METPVDYVSHIEQERKYYNPKDHVLKRKQRIIKCKEKYQDANQLYLQSLTKTKVDNKEMLRVNSSSADLPHHWAHVPNICMNHNINELRRRLERKNPLRNSNSSSATSINKTKENLRDSSEVYNAGLKVHGLRPTRIVHN